MITIVDYVQRTNADGEEFYALLIEGGVEMVQSNETGQFYATARRASISSTFTEKRCEQLIGTQVEGSIKRVACEPYEYTIPETGEVITKEHRWAYVPPASVEKEVFEDTIV